MFSNTRNYNISIKPELKGHKPLTYYSLIGTLSENMFPTRADAAYLTLHYGTSCALDYRIIPRNMLKLARNLFAKLFTNFS